MPTLHGLREPYAGLSSWFVGAAPSQVRGIGNETSLSRAMDKMLLLEGSFGHRLLATGRWLLRDRLELGCGHFLSVLMLRLLMDSPFTELESTRLSLPRCFLTGVVGGRPGYICHG